MININKLNILIEKKVLDEADLIVAFNKTSFSEGFFLYYRYLKSNKEFKTFFSNDALLQLNSSINEYQKKIKCFKCSLEFNKDNIKICEICFKTIHAACYNSDNSNKKMALR